MFFMVPYGDTHQKMEGMQECQDLSLETYCSVLLEIVLYASADYIECQWFVLISEVPTYDRNFTLFVGHIIDIEQYVGVEDQI